MPYFVFEVTPHCQLDCKYCYNVWKHPARGKHIVPNELSPEKIKELFVRLKSQTSISGVTLAGGEPLLRTDLEQIIRILFDLRIPVFLSTNGELLTQEKITSLYRSGIEYIEISLNTLTPEVDKSMGRLSDLKRIKQGLLTAKRMYINASINCILTRYNYTELEDVLKLAFAFTVDRVRINPYCGGDRRSRFRLNPDQLGTALSIADRFAAHFPVAVDVTVPVRFCELNRRDYPNLRFGACVCGRDKWAIDSEGNLRICEQSPTVLGNLLENDWGTLSASPAVKSFLTSYHRDDCEECADFQRCGGGCRYDRYK